jgi:Co/Zn/Cd efflux system component
MTPSIPTENPYIPEDDDDLPLEQYDDVPFDQCYDLHFEQGDGFQIEQCNGIDKNGDLDELGVTEESHVPSNERILGFAFWTFLIFTLTQITFAFIAGSHAMIGDSVAMLIDSVTYLFNYMAERTKHRYDAAAASREEDAPERIQKRNRRKMVLELEILTPSISVTALMTLTVVVMTQAVQTLLLDLHRLASEQQVPNITIMLAFSLTNLALDVLNISCFARAKHLMGYSTKVKTDAGREESGLDQLSTNCDTGQVREIQIRTQSNGKCMKTVDRETMSTTDSNDLATMQSRQGENINPPAENMIQSRTNQLRAHSDQPYGHHRDHEEDDTNLNMCSAYTHVFADTLRSVAVLVAAVVALLGPNVTPEVADSFGSVVVSLLILFTVVPLVHGLVRSVSELRAIRREERLELSTQ